MKSKLIFYLLTVIFLKSCQKEEKNFSANDKTSVVADKKEEYCPVFPRLREPESHRHAGDLKRRTCCPVS